jgi:hypothetical protein
MNMRYRKPRVALLVMIAASLAAIVSSVAGTVAVIETFFTHTRDPEPRSRRVFAFYKPRTLAEWAKESETLRARLRQMPPLMTEGLWDAQIEAIRNLEQSFAEDRPWALIQMAMGFRAISMPPGPDRGVDSANADMLQRIDWMVTLLTV